MRQKCVVLTGAGISAESGIKTFRDADGLWEGHDVMEVASPLGWLKNRSLVLDFYNQRRAQLNEVEPNGAHYALKELEERYDVYIITQNVDDLHERAGSSQVIHLHGELRKARSVGDASLVYDWKGDINEGDTCELGFQLRPHIVWFGESVPLIETAAEICETADVLLIFGTSMQVYPAAGLVDYAPRNIPKYYIDRSPAEVQVDHLNVVADLASAGVSRVVQELLS